MTLQQTNGSSKWARSQVLVTGATGLLGSHLTRMLVESGANVVALVRDFVPKSLFFCEDPEWRLDRRCTIVRGDLQDFGLLERAMNEYEIDSVFHLGAQTLVMTANESPLGTFRSNIEGTWNVLEAARLHQKRIQRVVVASSDKAYGNMGGDAYREDSPLRGEHPYDVSKSCSDLIARAFTVTYGLPVAVTRLGNMYGPGDLNFSRLVPGTIRDIVLNQRPVIRSDGKFIRDYIFVEDAAHAYLDLAEKMIRKADGKVAHAGEAFNFSYGLKLSVIDLVDKILAQMGRKDLKPEILGTAKNEIPVQRLDSTKATEILGWKPRYGFDEGLKRTIAWYQKTCSR